MKGNCFLLWLMGAKLQLQLLECLIYALILGFLILEDCLYVPNVRRNLISATQLGRHGYCVILKDNVVIKKDKVFIYSGDIVDGLYIINPNKHELYNSELDNNSHVKSLKRKFPSTSDAYLWHLHLGHINSNKIQRLVQDGFQNYQILMNSQSVNPAWKVK